MVKKETVAEHWGEPCEWYDPLHKDGLQCHTCKAWDAYTYLTGEKIRYKGVENWDKE